MADIPRLAAMVASDRSSRSTSAAVGSQSAAPCSQRTNASWASRYGFKETPPFSAHITTDRAGIFSGPSLPKSVQIACLRATPARPLLRAAVGLAADARNVAADDLVPHDMRG